MIKKLTYKLSKLGIACFIMLSLLIPVYAVDSQESIDAFTAQMTKVENLDFSKVDKLEDVREVVVYARHLYDSLSQADQETIDEAKTTALAEAEAKVLNLWIEELLPFDSFADSGMAWVIDEQYESLVDKLDEATVESLVPQYEKLEEFYENVVPKLQAQKRNDYAKAMEVEKIINNMQVLKLSDKKEAEAARKAYDQLTGLQKAYVTNYELLKEAENNIAKWENKALPHTAPKNIVYSGTRSSTYGPGTPWLSVKQWESVINDMKTYFPNSESTMVWIIGSLSGSGVNLEFARPSWLTDEWLAEESYRSLDNIKFSEPTREGHEPHETYFDAFDKLGVKVYLQVESGYSDMRTLMDIIMKEYGHHECIAGFGVDVEWYWGVSEDAGLPVTDDLAELWDTHLKSIDKDYRMFLKHYNTNFLPATYRSDILFVNDSQSFGSMNGDALGQYDENIDDVLGFIPEFKCFADTFAPNDVIYQIGYKPDRMWYYTLNDSVIQSLGEKLAEVTDQNCGIAWVDFTLKDNLTFPQLVDNTKKLSNIKELVGYFRNGGSNMVGKRFANDEATLRDALFVKRVNELIEGLSTKEQRELWAMFTSDNDKKALTGFSDAQAKAIDIRIAHLPEVLREKDVETVKKLEADFNKLSLEEKEKVTGKIPDISDLIKPDQPIVDDKEEPTTPPTQNPIDKTPETGDTTSIVMMSMMTMASLVAAGYIYLNKKEY